MNTDERLPLNRHTVRQAKQSGRHRVPGARRSLPGLTCAERPRSVWNAGGDEAREILPT